MTDMLDTFWAAINQQLEQLRTATNADDVLRTLATDQGPDRGFFAGSGETRPSAPPCTTQAGN
ncbi:hypothetical protein ACFQ60_48060 [Streptomyces zhihengii]